MDVAMISAQTIDRSLTSGAARTSAPSAGFAASIAAELNDQSATLARAEELIGTRIRAPEGGCGCDAFVSTVVQEPAAPSAAPSAVPTAAPSARTLDLRQISPATPQSVGATPTDVSPGQVLVLDNPADLGDHLHQAILRNATEMISANRNGLIEVLSIPWDQVRSR